MENGRAKEIIVNILQEAFRTNDANNFNPQFVADAILSRVIFEKTYNQMKCDKIVGTLTESIVIENLIPTEQYLQDIEEQEKSASYTEKYLKNFVQGKITAYNEILETLNTIK